MKLENYEEHVKDLFQLLKEKNGNSPVERLEITYTPQYINVYMQINNTSKIKQYHYLYESKELKLWNELIADNFVPKQKNKL